MADCGQGFAVDRAGEIEGSRSIPPEKILPDAVPLGLVFNCSQVHPWFHCAYPDEYIAKGLLSDGLPS